MAYGLISTRREAVGLGFPAAADDVDVVIVEEQPDVGLLGGWSTVVGIRLDEVRDRQHAGEDRLVQAAVDLQRLGQANCADRRAIVRVARHHGGRHGRRRVSRKLVGRARLSGRARRCRQQCNAHGQQGDGPDRVPGDCAGREPPGAVHACTILTRTACLPWTHVQTYAA
jgi:hypothetical protein